MDLARLLRPASVAIVGASDKVGSLGRAVLSNLERFAYPGDVHLVNPNRDAIDGRRCVRTTGDLPHGVDVAVLAIPGAAVLEEVRTLARRGVGGVVVFSAGFAEGGDEGIRLQAEIARVAKDAGMVVLGPNCLGFVNHAAGVPLTFVETPVLPRRQGRRIGIVSQSGAMAVVLGTTLEAKELSVSLSVSTGNEAATGVEDFLEHVLEDPDAAVVGMIVEHFRDPRRFLALAARARAQGRAIVLLHPGTSSAARASAATHTGALAGDWETMRAKTTRAGVVLVEGLEELGDALDILARAPALPAGGCAIVTESGAFKALALDVAERIGLPLPALPEDAAAAIRAAVPPFIGVSNPMDLTAQSLVDPDIFRRVLAPLVAAPEFGAIIMGIIQTDRVTAERKLPAIVEAVRTLRPGKPVLLAGLDEGAPTPPELIAEMRAAGVPYFPSPDRALRALVRVAAARDVPPPSTPAAAIAVRTPEGVTPEHHAKALLAPHGIAFPAGGMATSIDEAVTIAGRVGYPVVLKAQSPAMSHKSDAGGVALGISDEEALRRAWRTMHHRIAALVPPPLLDGFLVETMAERGVELIVGGRNDPKWGATLLVGLGGVAAEVFRDVRVLPADLDREGIVRELRRLGAAPLLDGFRGAPPVDVDAVADIAATVGRILDGSPEIAEIDLNPVVALPVGRGAIALDALIVSRDRRPLTDS